MKPAHLFSVRIGRRTVRVFVWPDLKSFRWGTATPGGDLLGMFLYESKSRRVGEIHLRKGYVNAEIVAHECFHATARMARLAKIRMCGGSGEEPCATTIGLMVSRICERLKRLGAWED